MDMITLKKKLSAYESDKGYLMNVSNDVLYEVLVSWENWTGASKEFYRSLGFTQRQMATIIGKAKKMKREGHFGEGEFKPVKVDVSLADSSSAASQSPVEIVWSDGRIIRFLHVDLLVDFLKKAA